MRAEFRIQGLLEALADSAATVLVVPSFFVHNLLSARWHSVGDVQALSIYDTPTGGVGGWVKRSEDVVLSLLLLVVLAIPMMLIALAIRLTSRGPALFVQERYGLGRRNIRVWKFRTMSVMENGEAVVQASRDDARVTKLGRWLRATSLDELPQLFNVLGGSMSIVGPRPHAVAHNEEYRKRIRGYMLRHKVKPGMTGLAQINGYRGETDTLAKMETRVRYDLDYINRWSLWLDIKVLILTVAKGSMFDRNAY
jgi:putative colanic acid biosynthesis UDP-glucose lipid carrier transferase